MLESAKEHVVQKLCPWAVVSVWGYVGQPITWLDSPPSTGLLTERENDYSIVVLPNDQYILFVVSGSGDSFQTV